MASVVLVMVGAAEADSIVSDFDDGSMQGWTYTGDVAESAVKGGGPPGSTFYAQVVDEALGGTMTAVAPAAFDGDWRPYEGAGALSADVALLSLVGGGDFVIPVRFTIAGPNGSARKDFGFPPIGPWRNYVVPIEESAWTMTGGTWAGLIREVTHFSITMEYATGTDTTGLDNVMLSSDLHIDWKTVDGGGVLESSAHDLALSGTIGQFDAAEMTDGHLTLVSGFWAVTVPEPAGAFEIVAASSCLLHDDGGPNEALLCIDLGESNGVEPRQFGPEQIQVEVSAELDNATLIPANVQMTCVNQVPGNVLIAPTGATSFLVKFDFAVADMDCCTLTFDGVQSTSGDALVDDVTLIPLQGDMDFSGGVSGGDASLIKPHFGEIVGVDLTHPKWDFDRNGGVTGGDFSLIKPLFNRVAPACP